MKMSKDFGHGTLQQEWIRWKSDANDEFLHVRFGQYILNKYLEEGSCPDIYYETDATKAYLKIMKACGFPL